MHEVCGDYVVISPYVFKKDACILFDEEVIKIRGNPLKNMKKHRKIHIVTHGLASAHTHLGLYPLRGSLGFGSQLDSWVLEHVWVWERFLRSNPEASYYISLKALLDLLRSGVTAVADMHFNEERVAEAGAELGVRMDLSTPIMDGGVFTSFEEALRENLDLLRKVKNEKKIRVRLGPCTPRLLTPKQFKEVVELAKELGIGIHTHLAEVEEDIIYLRRCCDLTLREFLNYTGILKAKSLVAHGIWTSSVIDLLIQARDVWVVNTPRSNTALGDGITPVLTLLKNGKKVALGIDVAPTYNLLDEMNAFLHTHYGGGRMIPPEKVLESATVNGYLALGIGSGEIRPGEPADIVVWEVKPDIVGGSPAHLIVSGIGRPVDIYVGGEAVLKEGKPLKARLDERYIVSKINDFITKFKSEWP